MLLRRVFAACPLLFFAATEMMGKSVVVDAVTGEPLAGVSVFDRYGALRGFTSMGGTLPEIGADNYPLALKSIGFEELEVSSPCDTLRMRNISYDLPELKVFDKEPKVMHMLAYLREYSTLTTYTDTVTMFREKWVDFMIPNNPRMKFKGWSVPRTLTSRSYYHIKDAYGTDSVSDRFNNHFSWSDWVGVPDSMVVPAVLTASEWGDLNQSGKYGNVVSWQRRGDKLKCDIDLLADTVALCWVPSLKRFFHAGVDFDMFRLTFNFNDYIGGNVKARDLSGFCFTVDSRGRGRDMFMFNHVDQPFFVTTYAELYVIDKELIPVKEAKDWQNQRFEYNDFDRLLLPDEVPRLSSSVSSLIERVENIDHRSAQLALKPDPILKGKELRRATAADVLLKRLRSMRQSLYHGYTKMNDKKLKEMRKRLERKAELKEIEEEIMKPYGQPPAQE